MTSRFSMGFLSGNSRTSSDPGDLISGHYDVMILVSSWDRRCMCVTEIESLRASKGIVILFDQRDSGGLRDAHDRRLLEYARRQSDRLETVRGQSVNVTKLWHDILVQIQDARHSHGYPLRIFLDLSTCPRYYAMALLSVCLGGGVAKRITFLYSEAQYPESTEDREEFTVGPWRPVAVPDLEGRYDPGKKRFYLIALGWEGAKVERLVARADPDRISVLFPTPGARPDYADRTQRKNEELLRQFRIPESQIVKTHASDAVGAWRALSQANLERPDHENTYYLCCGTKPHSLALALRAMELKHPAVLYVVPDCHHVLDIVPSGNYWSFDIEDLTALA